jgi:hypothetical protein
MIDDNWLLLASGRFPSACGQAAASLAYWSNTDPSSLCYDCQGFGISIPPRNHFVIFNFSFIQL